MFYPLDVEPWELSEIPDSPDKKFLKNSVESILAEIPPIVFDDCTDGFIKEKSPTTAMAEHNKVFTITSTHSLSSVRKIIILNTIFLQSVDATN